MTTTTITQPRTPRGHLHAEAFCLMWYRCERCQHLERFWNSRDGVTPFGTQCPSCGQPTLQHAFFGSDKYAPDHKPPVGQKVWIDMTRERAEHFIRKRIKAYKLQGHDALPSEADINLHVAAMFDHGTPPDMAVSGYGWELT